MKRIFKLLYIFLVSAAMATTAGCSERQEDADRLFYSELKSVNKLVLAQMRVSKMATIDDLSLKDAEGLRQTVEAAADAMKVGTRKAAYSYDTYLRAYIDLSEIRPEDIILDQESRILTINLPEIKVESQGRDIGIREEHYRVTGLRSEIKPAERAIVKEKMNTALKHEIAGNPAFRNQLVSRARTKAAAYFSAIGSKEGYQTIVNFKNAV